MSTAEPSFRLTKEPCGARAARPERLARDAFAPDFASPLGEPPAQEELSQVILSFDVEEHDRIEAAAGLAVGPALKAEYRRRVEPATRWLLDELARFDVKATFYVVGETARRNKALVRAMVEAGHEVGSHSWDHRRVHNLTPATFREDVRKSRDVLEQITGQPVRGYRAPTFSVVRQTAWAIDVLAEQGFAYDSSIYPVWHDRYGVPRAPRAPFRVRGTTHELLELPPVTLRLLRTNLPVGGGGYFRLLPLCFMKWGLRQVARRCEPAVAMLYFHPWEFDPDQPRLPLSRLRRFRTYVGIHRTRGRLRGLLEGRRFARAIDVAKRLNVSWGTLPGFDLNA
jgi:polysaccharide deacetylase family protein (PEP-CTERM system associated)